MSDKGKRTPATRERFARPNGGGQDSTSIPAHKVKKAFEQIAEQIRDMIFRGSLVRGDKLPSEAELAASFGVSRTTVREALRLLAAQNLIRTDKGAHGGSFVTLPPVSEVSAALNANISLLTAAQDVTLEEFIEMRLMLEVPSARIAAERGVKDVLGRVDESVPETPENLTTQQQFSYNRDFHSAIAEATGNTLVVIAAQPVFSIMQTNLARSVLDEDFHQTINRHHHVIADAIRAHDGDAAEELMRDHINSLVPYYEKAWKHARKDALNEPSP